MNQKYVTLGVIYRGHDTSAVLMIGGEIVAAGEQERFDLLKHSRAFPHGAIRECLQIGGISREDVNEVAVGADCNDPIRKAYRQPVPEDQARIDF